jgi:hypothetical protein
MEKSNVITLRNVVPMKPKAPIVFDIYVQVIDDGSGALPGQDALGGLVTPDLPWPLDDLIKE